MRSTSTALAVFSAFLIPAILAPVLAAEPGDVIARVGDQTITFSEINTMLNSSAVVGLSIPALGTPERDTVRITLLDKFISANLLYLDARKHGLEKDPEYRRDLRRFADGVLAGLYTRHHEEADVRVSNDEIEAFYKKNIKPGSELTDQVRTVIEATLRRDKLKQARSRLQAGLRKGVKIIVYDKAIDPAGDKVRADAEPVARVGDETLTWGDVKAQLIAAGKGAIRADPLAMESEARRTALERAIDARILAAKARAEGLERDPVYRARYDEYRKTSLINLYRERLVERMQPSQAELAAYYDKNRDRIMEPEARKVQIVVLKTREEAERIKADIEAGKLTMYQAAQGNSIASKAKEDLGEIGWVNKGTSLPAVDAVIFAAKPGRVAGPVQAPKGWDLVSVLDVRGAQYTDLKDEKTRQLTRRRLVHDKLNRYTTELREKQFPVTVYQDVLVRLAQQEANMVKSLAAKGEAPDSVTHKRIQEMQKLLGH